MSDWKDGTEGNEAGVADMEYADGLPTPAQDAALEIHRSGGDISSQLRREVAYEQSNVGVKRATEGGELVAQAQCDLPAEQDDYEAWLEEEDEDSEVEPLFLEIGQDGKEAGYLLCKQTEEKHELLKVVLLRQHDACKLFPKPYKSGSPIICFSNDGLNPSCENPKYDGEEENPCLGIWRTVNGKSECIAPCEFANFQDGTPPRCQRGKQNLIMEIGDETFMPYWLWIKSIGLKPLKGLMNKLNIAVKTTVISRKKRGLGKARRCLFSFDVTCAEDVRESGKSQQAAFGNVQEVSDELNEPLGRMAHACKDKFCESRLDEAAIAKFRADNPATDY